MIDAGQANASHNHAGACIATGGQGTTKGTRVPPANAVSTVIIPEGARPHPIMDCALAGMNDGAQNNKAATKIVLMILRKLIVAPVNVPGIAKLPELLRQSN
jgi:hypothetical protein